MKTAVLGYGTVGKGVYEIISNSDLLECGPVLVREGKATQPFMTSSIDEILNDSSIEAVVECIGGTDCAYKYVKSCLAAKKHVVTSNKALVAAYGIELSRIAYDNDVAFLFSAACGGAIPVLHNISVARESDSVLSCRGILNGTTNFILSNLKDGRFSCYSEALAEAQKLGYAEADPTADISGLDTLRKVILVSAVAFNKLPESGLINEGIENIDLNTIRDASVKLVGFCGINKDKSIYAFAEPVICRKNSALSGIVSNYNFFEYTGHYCGTISLCGQGAGSYPTASAVLRDLTSIIRRERQMISKTCTSAVADNSQILHRYVVCTGSRTYRTEKISVKQMHEDAAEMRKTGNKVFFASIEE